MSSTEPPPPAAQNDAQLGEILPPLVTKASAERKISRKLRYAIGQVALGSSICAAAKAAGMHRNGLTDALKRPQVIAMLEQTIRSNLAASAGKAAMRLDSLITSARSEYVQLEASKAVLDRAGYGTVATTGVAGDVVIQINL